MSLEEHIRKIVVEELAKHQPAVEVIPVSDFCEAKNIARSTVWRAEKEGKIKLRRIGRKVFINPQEWVS